MTLENIVAAYIRECRPDAEAEAEEFRRLPSLREAIREAALCHRHQRRIHPAILAEAERRLQNASGALGAATDFQALHDAVARQIGDIRGIGELAVYDIEHRIGAFLGRKPTLVDLHRGTRKGARALGFTGTTLDPARLPSAFSRLTPAEIEDCLCLYKEALRGDQLRTGVSQHVSHCISSHTKHAQKC
jgi:hypothetical protein